MHFLKAFRTFVLGLVKTGRRVVIVCGGGKTARHYIHAASEVMDHIDPEDLDWLGIPPRGSTRTCSVRCFAVLRTRTSSNTLARTPRHWREKVLVAAGWKPGWSTDYVASRIAGLLGVKHIVNASNIDGVFTADPKKDPTAKLVKEYSWHDYCAMVGDTWDPGLSAPFDPVASKYCQRHEISVAIIDGKISPTSKKSSTARSSRGRCCHKTQRRGRHECLTSPVTFQ